MHEGGTTAIVPRDYLDLAAYWADAVDLIGLHNELKSVGQLSSRFRVVCVDMCWIGNGVVRPLEAAPERGTLYLARVDQNHFVPLLRSTTRGGLVVVDAAASSGTAGGPGVAGGVVSGELPARLRRAGFSVGEGEGEGEGGASEGSGRVSGPAAAMG
jgi:hypothetical protein